MYLSLVIHDIAKKQLFCEFLYFEKNSRNKQFVYFTLPRLDHILALCF